MEPGDTFLMPSGTHHNPNAMHLFVVCSLLRNENEVLLASIATWRNHLCDSTCILTPGCHPFINRKSYVFYRSSRIEKIADLEFGLGQLHFIEKDPMPAELVERMLDGFLASKQTKRGIKKRLKAEYGWQ